MRYSISGLPIETITKKVVQVGGVNVKVSPLVGQVFCELTNQQVLQLQQMGLSPKLVKKVGPSIVPLMVKAAGTVPGVEIAPLRDAYTPVLTGAGLTVAVLDSGVRKTHNELLDKVIHEVNYSDASGVDDVFNHGTQVASIIAGLECGVSPGAYIMNIKVLNDEGVGDDETIIDGIEEICRLVQSAKGAGIHFTDPEYPNVINLSLGREDDDDPDSSIKLAARVALEQYGVEVIAAAGNTGPKMSTMQAPASEPTVIAVGGAETLTLQLWDKSARGPTLCGDTKPDFVSWATDIQAASAEGNDIYISKSGTSFAAPIVSGMRGLLDEIVRRRYGQDFILPWTSVKEFASAVCVKPSEAAVGKDNSWGFGIPVFSMVAQGVSEPTFDLAPMVTMMGMMMVMGMMVRGFR